MFKLSATPNKDELKLQLDNDCLLDQTVVRVSKDRVSTQSGTYERGLKFHTTTYVMLIQQPDSIFPEFSFDYGKTWSNSRIKARKSAGRAKIMLERNTEKEFAYNKIQAINRKWGDA